MSTALFNERVFNGGEPPRIVGVRAATVVSRRMVRQCESRSAVSVRTNVLLEPATEVNVRHARLCDCGAVAGISRSRERQSAAAISVARDSVCSAVSRFRVDRRLVSGCGTTVRFDRVRARDFTTGVTFPGVLDRPCWTTVAVAARRDRRAAVCAQVNRIRHRNSASGIQIDRSWFRTHLFALLPSVWQEQDTTGDLAAFLNIPAATLDEFKNRVDALPSMFDVDNCEPAFLPLLAALTGWPLDPDVHTDDQRRALLEAVEFYRRKGSIPAIIRSLENVGWRGRIDETFRRTFRLNRRAVMNRRRLPGEVFSLGVYRIESDTITAGLREALAPHHPAGARRFFLQRLGDLGEASIRDAGISGVQARQFATARSKETFVLARNRLNSDFHLTWKNKTALLCGISASHAVRQGLTGAASYLSRWHARRRGFRVNQDALNSGRFQSFWIGEQKVCLRFPVDTESEDGSAYFNVGLRLGSTPLNRASLRLSRAEFHWVYRQRNLLDAVQAGPRAAANLLRVTRWPAEQEI